MVRSALENNKPVAFTETRRTGGDYRDSHQGSTIKIRSTTTTTYDYLYDWGGVDKMDDIPKDGETDESEDDSKDSTLRHGTDEVKSFNIQDLFDTTGADPLMDESEDEGKDSTLRHSMDDIKSFHIPDSIDITEANPPQTDCNTTDGIQEPRENNDSSKAETNTEEGIIETETPSKHYRDMGTQSNVGF